MRREDSLKRNAIIMEIGTILSKGFSILIMPFFSRWLSPEEYGNFDVVATYASLCLPLATFALSEAIFRFLIEAKDAKEEKKIASTSCAMVLCGFTVVGVVLYILLSSTSLSDIRYAFLVYFFADIVNNITLYYVRGTKKTVLYTVSSSFNMPFLFLFVFIFVKKLELGCNGMLIGYASALLCCSLIGFVGSKMYQSLSIKAIEFSYAKTLLKYSIPMIPNSISWWILNASDRSIINIFVGASANGIYAMAYKIPTFCTTLVNTFHYSWVENISTHINDSDRDQYIRKVFNNYASTILSICIGITSVSYLLFRFFIDDAYITACLYAPILAASVFFSATSMFIGGVFVAFKDSKENGFSTVFSAVINIIIHLSLVSLIGLYAAAVSTLASYAILLVLRMYRLRKKYHIALKFDRRTGMLALAYCYFIFAQYIISIPLHLINVMLACIVVLLVNKSLVLSTIRDLKKAIINKR
ncbi:MAG: oligosaccharide flippase family protein [Lachnospiraceae bacterium]|nr:oligosaccharide flippase family protein [Lachnospiraceae bacterium]